MSFAAPNSFTYQGQIIKPNGLPLEANSVTFTVEILSPGAEECLLYQEQQTINMQNSNGIFSLAVGMGTRSGTDYEDTNPLTTALSNTTGLVTPTYCAAVGTYTPVLTDGRKLRLTFDDGSGPSTIDVDHDVISVPYAASASSIDGLVTADLLQIDTSTGYNLSQANLAFVFTDANWTELQALLNGTSASFSFATPTSDVDFGNQKIINLATPTANNDAANKGYVDGNIGGAAADSAGIAALAGGADIGKSLNWNGTQWVAQTVDDTTKLSLDGSDTMAGNLAMGGNDITGANDVAVGNDLTVGNDATVTGNVTVTGSISANGVSTGTTLALYNGANFMGFQAQAGSSDLIWQLPTADGGANQVLQTNGAGVLQWTTLPVDGLTSLNGETGATQTFANGATGTAPAFSSAANVHTLNIPLANGAGVTSGTISKTEFDDFDQKLDPTLTNGQIFVGNGSNVATGVAMSGDATIINTGAVTIANNAITSAKINDGEIVNADINASAAIAATKISAGNVDNTEFDYLDGVTSAIQTQLNGKVNDTGDTMTGQLYIDGGADEAQLRVDANGTQTGNILEVRSSAGTNLATVSSDGSITAATDLTTKNYVDTAISGIAQDAILDADSDTQIQVEESADEDIIRFDTAGSERMMINASGRVGIGTDTPDTILEIAGTLKVADGSEACGAAADGGMIRYSGTDLQYCNGTAWQTLGISGGISTLGGLSTAAQGFATGSTGTAPNFASAGSTHTLNIPLANGAGVTSGTISKTEFDDFDQKLDPALTDGQIFVGNAGNVATGVAMSGDATMINTGALTIANNAITSAKINDGEIVDADINASAAIAATKISAGNVDNTEFDYLDGVTSAIQTQLNGKVNDTGDTMTGQLYVDGGADEVQIRVDAEAAQSVNILELRDSAGTNLATVSSDGSISAATDLTTKNYVDTAVSGISTDSIVDADADTQIQVEESGDEDIIRFDTAGAERMTIGAAGMVSVAGTFKLADGGETCTIAGDAGMMRYNGGNLEYCNGASWQTLGISGGISSLGGLSTAAQGFATGSTGTAPAFSSAGSTHTLNIPLANGAGVTSGTISKTEFDDFDQKLDPSLTDGQIFVGNGSNVATGVAMSGDATMINTGAVTIANNAITSAKINDGEIVDADINASAAIAATKISAGNVDNTEFDYLDGVTSAIQTQLNGKVNDTGDTMTGQLYVDGGADEVQVRIDGNAVQTANLFEIRNSGGTEQVVIAADGDVGIGVPSPSTILDIAGTIQVADGGETCSAGADGGMIRYSGTNLQYCNGTAWQTLGISGAGLTSFNGETGSTQSLAVGASGTAPAWSSATNTHTLNIPLASGAGVTSGTISKTEFDDFDQKLDPSLTDGQIFVGNGSNVATGVAMSGDATMINTGAVTIANNAITSAKINDGEIVDADINASAAIAATKISAGNVDNTEFDYLDGVTSAIQTQLNGKVNDTGDTMTGQLYVDGGADEVQIRVDAEAAQSVNILELRDSAGTNLATVSSDGSISAATDLTTKNYVDTAVSGISTDSIVDADADTQIQVEESADEDIIRFDTAGTERMVIGAAGMVSVAGTFKLADGGETCTIAGDAGMMRYNGGNLEYCNGSAWTTLGVSGAGLTNFNGETGSTQSLAIGATGTAPAWSSATNTHTLNIPLASGAGVTSGTISKTDYDDFDQKLDPSLTDGQIFVGNGSNVATGVAMSGDATMINTGAVTIANNAITSAKINDGEIVDADIHASAAIARSKFAAGNANRLVVNDGSGNMIDAAAITGNRALTSDANGIPVASSVTDTELGYLSGVTSAIQTQLNGKVNDTGDTMTGQLYVDGGADEVQVRIDGNAVQTANLFEVRNSGGTEQVVIAADGDVGIGVPSPSTILDIAGTIQVADGGETCSGGADGGMIRYSGTDLQYCNGSSWQTLGISGAGLTSFNGETGSSQSLAIGAAGTAPAWSSGTNTHTLNIPLASGAGVTSGTISKTDYDSFNAKVDRSGDTMTGQLFVDGGADEVQIRVDADASQSANILELRSSAGANLATVSSDGSISAATDLTTKNYVDTAVSGISTDSIVDADADTQIQVEESGDEDIIRFDTAGAERMVIDASGFVGITTTNPVYNLHVFDPAGFTRAQNDHNVRHSLYVERTRADSTAPNAGFGSAIGFNLEGSADGVMAYNTSEIRSIWENNQTNATTDRDASLALFTMQDSTSSERMRITSSGNVGIGTDAPAVDLDVHTGSINAAEICDENNANCLDLSAGVGSGDFMADGTVAMTGAIRMPDGAAGTPSLTFTDDTNTGIYSPFDGVMDFVASGSTSLQVSDTGVTSQRSFGVTFAQDQPYSSSSVATDRPGAGTIISNIDDTSANEYVGISLDVRNLSSTSQEAYFGVVANGSGNTPDIVIGQQTGATAYDERMRIDASGNVGIGTDAPAVALDVHTGSINAAEICDENNANCIDLDTFSPGTGNGDFLADGSVAMTGDLQLSQRILGGNTSNIINTGTAATQDLTIQTSDADLRLRTINNDDILFIGNNLERMRVVGSTGRVGIGTATPAVELDVNTGTINAASICDENNANCLDLSAGVGGGASAIDGLSDGDTSSATSVVILGPSAGTSNSGNNNTALGNGTLGSAGVGTSGGANTAIGKSSLESLTTGSNNTALGFSSAWNLDTGIDNVAIGRYALPEATSGRGNVAVGTTAGRNNTTGDYNTAVGAEAIGNAGSTDGAMGGNTAVGRRAGYQLGSGANNNVMLGASAGQNITSGDSNIMIGVNAQATSATASNELNIGDTIYGNLSTGNVGIGTSNPQSLLHLAGTDYETQFDASGPQYFGKHSGTGNAGITFNKERAGAKAEDDDPIGMIINKTWDGDQYHHTAWIRAAVDGATGDNDVPARIEFHTRNDGGAGSLQERMRIDNAGNVGIGTDAPAVELDVHTGTINAAQICDENNANCLDLSAGVGGGATDIDGLSDAATASAQSNMFIGHSGGSFGTNDQFNLGVGYRALDGLNNDPTAFEGDLNTAIGHDALSAINSGRQNAGVGAQALQNGTSASRNSVLGYSAMLNATTGSDNTVVGRSALEGNNTGSFNVALGSRAGQGVSGQNNSNNVFVGYQAGDSVSTGSDNILIGYDVDLPAATTNNHLNIGNTIYGDLSSGAIGIGTATPAAASNLHIYDGSVLAYLRIEGNGVGALSEVEGDGYARHYINDSGASANEAKYRMVSDAGVFTIEARNDVDSAGEIAMQIDRTGANVDSVSFPNSSVGIGTATPAVALDVHTGTINAAQICDENNANCLDLSAGVSGGDASYGSSASSPADAVYVNDSGFVGINETTPDAELDIEATSPMIHLTDSDAATNGNTHAGISIRNSSNGEHGKLQFSNNTRLALINEIDSGDIIVGTNDGDIIFENDNTSAEYMRIADGGNVGIGTTTIDEKLHVNGKVKTTEVVLSSDRNLKKDIQTVEANKIIAKFMSLRPVTYLWRAEDYPDREFSDEQQWGFIAQEVEQLFPELVSGREGDKAVNYQGLISPLVATVQEQQRKIQSLENKNQDLSDKLDKQQEQIDWLMQQMKDMKKSK